MSTTSLQLVAVTDGGTIQASTLDDVSELERNLG
jgi:hypothetical protein